MNNIDGSPESGELWPGRSEAGTVVLKITYYKNGDGPKICCSLQESIEAILMEDSDFRNGMEGNAPVQVFMYVVLILHD